MNEVNPMSQNYQLKMFFTRLWTFMMHITMIRLIPLQGFEIVSKCAGEGLVDVFQNRPL